MKRQTVKDFFRRNSIICRCRLLAIAVLMAGPGINAFAEQWPQFRGLRMNGVSESSHPIRWSASENVDWVIPLKGEGWSCPVVWDNQVFLTDAVPLDPGHDAADS